VACVALVIAPGPWLGVFSGTQFHPAPAAALAVMFVVLVSLLVVRAARLPGWPTAAILVTLALIKIGLGIADVPAGWRATYTMLTPDPPKVADLVWRAGVHRFRIDRTLGLSGTASRLPFLNDVHRYNRPGDAPPRSRSQALRVQWSGWFKAGGTGALEIYAQADGPTQIWLDNRTVAGADTGRPLEGLSLPAAAGWHRVTVLHDKPAGTVPALFAQLLFDGRPLVVRPWPAAPAVDSHVLARLGDGLTLAGLLWWIATMVRALSGAKVRDGGAAGAIVAVFASASLAVFAVVSAAPFDNGTYELRPGDDHLAYEGLARNILSEGILMPEGKAPGEGRPFFFYPLYSYVLAALHLALGDSYAVVVLLNAVATSALPVLFWLLGWRALDARVQTVGQLALVAFVVRHNARYFGSPLTDSLFIPLVFASLALAVRTLRTLRPADGFLTGCFIAAGATTRPSFFLFTAPAVVALLWGGRRQALLQRLKPSGALLAGYAMALSPVVLRNWIMAGQAVAMVTLSHAIPVSLIPPEMQAVTSFDGTDVYSWPSSLALAWKIIVADPAGVAWLEFRKVLFTLGLTNLGPGQPPLVVEFPVLCVAGLAAMVLRRVPTGQLLVLAAFLVSHLAAIVIAYPWTYGYKTILPVQLVFLFCALFLFSRYTGEADDAR
jgi:hypothetical protein